LTGDSSLFTYAAQTIAGGEGPYGGYILMHSPVAFIPGALAIALGHLLNVADELSIRYSSVLLVAASIWLTYFLGEALSQRRIVGVLAAAALGWNLLISQAAKGSQPKLITTLLILLMALAIQKRRWAWAGLSIGYAALAWAGALVLIPIPLMAALAQDRPSRWRALWHTIAGMLGALLTLAGYMAAKGTLAYLWLQYGRTVFRFVPSLAAGGAARSSAISLPALGQSIPKLTLPDQVMLALGIAGIVGYAWYTWRRSGKLWAALVSSCSSGILPESWPCGLRPYLTFNRQAI
jgi:hypothetical protein